MAAKSAPAKIARNPDPLPGADAFASPQRVAVVYQDERHGHTFARARGNRENAADELRTLLPIWAKHLGRHVEIATTNEYTAAIAAAARVVESSADAYGDYPPPMAQRENRSAVEKAAEDLACAEFEAEIKELAGEGIVQRAYYSDLLRHDAALAPDHVLYRRTQVSAFRGGLAFLHRWPAWGRSTDDYGDETVPFVDRVLSLVEEDDTEHGAVYVWDLAVLA